MSNFLDSKYIINLDLMQDTRNNTMHFNLSDSETSDFWINITRYTVDINEELLDKTVTLYVVKPNKNVEFGNISYDSTEKMYYCNLSSEFKNIKGNYTAQVVIYDSSTKERKVTRSKFKYYVEDDILSDASGTVKPEEQENILDDIISRLAALEEGGDGSTSASASNITITDTAGNFTATNVEDALAEAGSQIKEKASKNDLEVERARIDTFMSLEEGSTTGDAELIDGRIGADGAIYKNIGGAIRTQLKTVNYNVKKNIDSILEYHSIIDALKNKGIEIVSQKFSNLLDNIQNFEYDGGEFTIKIENNIITVNGTLNDFVYIKLTNSVDVGQGSSGGNKKSVWAQENCNLVSVGNKYSLKRYIINGTAMDNEGTASVAGSIVSSARTSSYTNVLSDSKGLVELAEEIAYIQLYLPLGIYDNLQIGVILQENEVTTEYTPNGYVKTEIEFPKNVADYPTVINGTKWLEIQGTYFNAVQGGCSDGEYIYCGVVHDSNDSGNTTLYKIDIKTKEIVKTVRSFSLGHCNSMTYCDYDGYIHCVSLDSKSTIHRVTTDLEYIDSYEINILTQYPESTGFGAIDYNKDKEIFTFLIRGDKKGYAIFTKNLTFVKIIWTEKIPSHVYGGICTDKNFIYQTVCGANDRNAEIGIFTWEGTLVASVNVDSWYGEIEEMFLVGNRMFTTAANFDYTNHEIWELTPNNFTLF